MARKYRLERACTCRHRSAECVAPGPVFHEVGDGDSLADLRAEADALASEVGVEYRVADADRRNAVVHWARLPGWSGLRLEAS